MAKESIEQYSRRTARRGRARRAPARHALRIGDASTRTRSTTRSTASLCDFDERAGLSTTASSTSSTAPDSSRSSPASSAASGLDAASRPTSGVVIEKPFGTTSSRRASSTAQCSTVFDERQIYRIDHYLGKETVQNLLAFRFANGIFEPSGTATTSTRRRSPPPRTSAIGTRAGYYDSAGALRDMVQNHMMQLLSLSRWSRRSRSSADAVRDEKLKVLAGDRAARRPTRSPTMAVRGQYAAGASRRRARARLPRGGGRAARLAHRDLRGAAPSVDNWRWAGVPFYLRTGKRLARKVTEIAVTFKPVPHLAFRQDGSVGVQPNQLVLTMQPDEGVSLSLGGEDPRRADADPSGQHGVPLRDRVHVAVAGGLRAAAPRRDARRRRPCSRATTRSRRCGRSSTRSSRPGRQ